ncbi:alpha/beta hydrolase family protein [Lutibacter maritimus]|uniref:Pimeloyl-ACP methyl ester carboxylesterase n=1 Tax=Lutibacter maritimus TaxID=593133 RepID=A0A1I6SK52_9FLAO|nr:alpha/beta hydrolase [Lutibacter maritimus]SFS77274.1 Pimeloyl-ACP methyl ester carboxylesterase [Lutibacter maritimus]
MENSKTHIYFVPGLAASSKIFEYLQFPEDKFELHFFEWLLPISENEPLEAYALRMAQLVKEKNPVLVGVSFGGIIVQEMSKHLHPKKVILISSIKSNKELPKRLKIIQKTKIYKLFPAHAIKNIEGFFKYAFGDYAKKRVKIYKEYLSVRDETYLKWAIYNVLHWNQKKPIENLIHIHGIDDEIFPIKHIKNCITINKGTHIMILQKAKKISEIIIDSLN